MNSTVLMALGEPSIFSTVLSQAGFFFGGPRTIPTTPGVITAQVRVWDTYAADGPPPTQFGAYVLFQITLADPNARPPGIPTTLTGLNGHPWSVGPVAVPEPTTIGLTGLGLAALVLLAFRP